MKLSRALLLLISLVLVAAGGVLVAQLVPKSAVAREASAAKSAANTRVTPSTTRVSGGTVSPDAPPATAPALTGNDMRALARVSASVTDGPTVAIEGDPDTKTLPSAKSLDMLRMLPSDWPTAFLVSTSALEGLGTPQAGRGAALQSQVTPALYAQWQRTLTTRASQGTFTVKRLSLATATLSATDTLPLIATGTYVDGTTRSGYVVAATATRTRLGWTITTARFESLGAVN